MNTLKIGCQKCLLSSGFCSFHDSEQKCPKNSEKEEIKCEIVEFDHETNVYERNDYTDFKIETVDHFPLPFNEFHDISQDSFKDIVNKQVANVSLTDDEIKHVKYSTRRQQSSNLWWKYRKEKLTESNFIIAAVNKIDPSKKIKSLFHPSVKTSSMKHGIANEQSIALTEYGTLLTSQSVTANLVQPGLISSKSYPFLKASRNSIVTNVDNREVWGVEIKCSS